MPSLIHHILSLTTVIVFSLAYSDGLDVNVRDVAQSLIEAPVADTPDGLGNPTLGFDAPGEADDWTKIADTSNGGTAQAVAAEPNNDVCSNTNIRRRETGKFCSFDGTPLELSPSSAQERKPSRGQFRKTRPRKKKATPGSPEAPGSSQDFGCPPGLSAVCGANELMRDPLSPGTSRIVPWNLGNIPPIIEVLDFCRYCTSAGL